MQNLGSNFYPKLVQIASELNMNPEDILAIMVFESGINPGAYEKKYHGAGLIGFMPDTLKGLGFDGKWSDFIKMKGEEQLDYVKQYIKNKAQFNGGPFTSAAQYYVANFYPVALKLPGIKSGDPNTIFLEANPATVTDPKTGRKYSKKYYDIGFKIDPKMESLAYKENPLFHGSVEGAITYKDMMKQVEKNRQNPLYRQAISNMKNTTGYQAAIQPNETTDTKTVSNDGFFDKLFSLLKKFVFASNSNKFLISVGSSDDRASTIEYAYILASALEEYLGAKIAICANQNNVELECEVNGDKKIMFNAVKELSNSISDVFKDATRKIGNITTFALVIANDKSDYPKLHPKMADMYHRMFKLKFVKGQ